MKDKFGNNSFNREDFLRKLNEDQDVNDHQEIESLFEKESEEGWALVKNKPEREKQLDEKFFETQVASSANKSKLKNAAPWVAIAASLLLLIGLFTFLKEQLNNKVIVSDNIIKQEPINEESDQKIQEKNIPLTDSIHPKITEKQNDENKNTKRSSKTNQLAETSYSAANEIAANQTKSVEISSMNSGNIYENVQNSMDDEAVSFKNSPAEGELPISEVPTEKMAAMTEESKDYLPEVKKKKIRTKSDYSPSASTISEENNLSPINFYFIGGDEALNKFILNNRKPISKLNAAYQFRVKISINKKSKAKLIEIVNPNDCEDCKKEIIRLVELMPDWQNTLKNNKVNEEIHEIIIELSPI